MTLISMVTAVPIINAITVGLIPLITAFTPEYFNRRVNIEAMRIMMINDGSATPTPTVSTRKRQRIILKKNGQRLTKD